MNEPALMAEAREEAQAGSVTRRAGLLCGAVLGWVCLCVGLVTAQEDGPPPSTDAAFPAALGRSFNAVYEQVSPAVVLVTSTHPWRASPRPLPLFHPPLPEEEFEGIGSGTVISPDGYVLSNYHLIEDADSILVTLSDRRTFAAKVVGADSLIDIALLKIDAVGLPVVRLGDSDELRIGDLVLAIGYPLGMGTTLTDGIVSALGRRASVIVREYGIESFIQTNAVINPGNSGGPLLNLRGEVVGINTAISTRTGYYIGYGLAVPINLAHEAARDIMSHGRVVRGYLGVRMTEVTQESIAAHELALERPRGVLVEGTEPGSPAERGGIARGDVLLSLEGEEVDWPNQVQTIVYSRDPGDAISLLVLRGGARQQVSVVLGEREEDRLLARGRERLSRLGIAVANLSREEARRLGFADEIAADLGFETGEQAIVVTRVELNGPAASKGIQVRDVITEVDQQRITSVQQFTRFVSVLEPDKSALFWFWRQDRGVDVRALRIPK